MKWLRNWKIWLLASLTLGLAPFGSEPHLVGKLKWVVGGAEGMAVMDWFDLCLHGFPFVLLLLAVVLRLRSRLTQDP
jgi:hypothetical protein